MGGTIETDGSVIQTAKTMNSMLNPRVFSLKRSAAWMAIVLALTGLGSLWVSDALEWDAAEQAIHSQFFSMGYGPQPPLYDWIVFGLFVLFPPSALGLVALKAVLLWLVFLFSGLFFRSITQQESLAVVGAFAVFMPAQLAWEAQRNLSHTVLAVMFAALFFYCVARLLTERNPTRSLWSYALLGAVITGGLLAKYNMLAVFVFSLVAVLAVPAFRARLSLSGTLLAIVIPAVLCLPHAWWAFHHLPDITEAMRGKLTPLAGQALSAVALRALGLKEFVLGVLGFLALPGAILMGLLLWDRKSRAARDELENYPDFHGFLRAGRVYLLLFLLMGAGMIIFGGVTQFRDRWFTPFLFLLPAFAMVVWIARHAYQLSAVIRIAKLVVVVAGVGLVARVPINGLMGTPGYANRPIDDLAAAIRSSTSPGALLVSQDIRLVGSLRFALPDRSVMLVPRFLDYPVKPACQILVLSPSDASGRNGGNGLVSDGAGRQWQWSGPMRFSADSFGVYGDRYELECPKAPS